ncbi:MAG: hypothetical protein ACJ8DT_03465, partial [Microvirga sp.]
MSIGAVFQRWLAVLAALAVGLRERWRARRVLVVARDGDGFVFRRDAAAGNEVLGSAPAGAKAPEAVLEAARDEVAAAGLSVDRVVAPASPDVAGGA